MLAGCATNNTVLVSTGTVIGVELGQNPSTGLYQAKLGYNRGEIALVPTTNKYTPDVITELKYNGIFSTGADSGIYQRMAVGSLAVAQPGAMAMFLKDGTGSISPGTVEALKSLSSIPTVNAASVGSTAKLASAYKVSQDKSKWDEVARANGYPSFSAFLIDSSASPAKVEAVTSGLKTANLLLP